MTDSPSPPDHREAARVWVLSDDRPGHYNISRGIVAALARLRPVEEHWIKLKLRIGAARQLLRPWLHLSGGRAPMALLRGCFRFDALPTEPPEVIVSTGGNTAFLNVALARRLGCRNLIAGKLRGLPPPWFTAVITALPMPGVANNITVDLAPTTIEPKAVAAAGDQYRREHGLGDQPLWSMIIGGDGGGFRYQQADWETLAKAMNRLAGEAGVKWLITTSRRSGAATEATLRAALEPGSLADAVWWAAQPRKVVMPFLGAAGRVFCTEDSATMLIEAMAAGRPVYSLAPRHARPDEAMIDLLQQHSDARHLCRVAIHDLAGLQALASPDSFQPVTASMPQQLAQRLLPFLPASWNRGCPVPV